MKTIEVPWFGEVAHDPEQLVGLLRGQHGGRLVEDEQVDVPGQRLEDLDALLGADRQVLDLGVGVDVEAVSLAELADHLAGLSEVEEACPGRLVAEDDVLGHRHDRHELEVLVDHADAPADRVAWGP